MSGEPELIGLAEAAGHFGKAGRGGRPVHPATLSRWIQAGVRGQSGARVKLRAVRIGAKWATTAAWLAEFVAATTAASGAGEGDAPRTPAERRRAADAAAAELAAIGA